VIIGDCDLSVVIWVARWVCPEKTIGIIDTYGLEWELHKSKQTITRSIGGHNGFVFSAHGLSRSPPHRE
jgi:hypothetical protein